MRFTKAYLIVICFISLLAFSVCLIFLSYNYETLISLVIKTTGKPYLESILRSGIFTPDKFAWLRRLCFSLLFINPVIVVLLIFFRKKILRVIGFIYHSLLQSSLALRNVFEQNNKWQNSSLIIVLALVTARSLYYIIHFDLQYDEMWSYNYFTAAPFYYPFIVSSNYPLYEICTGLFKYLPFDMKTNIRLPSLLAGMASCITLYACLRKYFGSHIVALGGMIVFAFMPVTTFYMLYARGVMFSLFFSIVAIFSILFWLRNQRDKRHLVIYTLATASAFYSMPTYLYLWFILFLLSFIVCLQHSRRQIKYIVLTNACAVVVSFFLYAPMLAGSGLSFLTSAAANDGSPAATWSNVLQYHFDVSYFFTGFTYGLTVVLIATLIILALKLKGKENIILLVLCCLLSVLPAVIFKFQDIQIAPRALAFSGLCLPLLFSFFLVQIAWRVNTLTVSFCIAVAGLGSAYISHHHSFLHWSEQQDKEAKELANLFIRNHIGTCYDSSSGSGFFYDYPAIEYYYRLQNHSFTLFTNAENSLRFKPLSAKDNYDCIVYPLTDTTTDKRYHSWYVNKKEGFNIFIRNTNDSTHH